MSDKCERCVSAENKLRVCEGALHAMSREAQQAVQAAHHWFRMAHGRGGTWHEVMDGVAHEEAVCQQQSS